MSDSILIRLRHHAKDERNTAFARSTMREVIDELARVTAQRDCKCDFRTYMLGDGCEVCNPAKSLEYAKETIAELRAELAASRERESRMREMIDCRTCRNYTRDGCIQTVQCVDGDGYRSVAPVRFWSAALAEGSPQ